MNAGPPKDRGADAFKKACRKQKEGSKALGEKVGIRGVASLANEPGEGVPSQDAKRPRHPSNGLVAAMQAFAFWKTSDAKARCQAGLRTGRA